MAFDNLFTPLRVGPMAVPNRIAETTYSIAAGRADGLPDAPFMEHHLQKARGGAGWIGSETWLLPTPLPPGRPTEAIPGMRALGFAAYDQPDFVERVRSFTDAVHGYGAVAVMQLTHLQTVMCPSPRQLALLHDFVPHELDEDEIQFILDTYWKAAEKFHLAGADGVEIHCAHEALPHWFLSPVSNERKDEWGGSPGNRVRFVVEAVRRIRQRVSPELAVGLRLCADEMREGGYGLNDMKEMVSLICEQVNVDFLNVDVGSSWGMPSYTSPMQVPVAAYADRAAAIREIVDIPVMYAGRINDIDVAERLVAEGQADLVGMTRALLADPSFPNKAREGRVNEIRKCIGCNTCISRTQSEDKTPTCAVNPEVGAELQWAQLKPASTAKHVVVVGGGPAGMECARVAASRGHRVTLLEREQALGGALRIAAQAPRRDEMLNFPRYETVELTRLGVDMHFGTEASAEEVLAFEPDAVVVATGAIPNTSTIRGADQVTVLTFRDVLRDKADPGENVVIVSEDDHMITPSVADYLASQGKRVIILQKWLMPLEKVDRYTKGVVLERLYQNGVDIRPSTRLREIRGDELLTYNVHTGKETWIREIDGIVLSLGMRADDRLHKDLKGSVEELYLVGSAFAPRFIAEATQHGAGVGCVL